MLAGLAIGLSSLLSGVQLTPGLVLLVFLPTLLFEAAFHLDFDHLQENRRYIVFTAMPAPLICTILIGGVLHLAVRQELPTAPLFGALIWATDPVSVAATVRELRLSRHLAHIIEVERPAHQPV